MSLRIRGLKLRATTNDGPYGAEFEFDDGLNIIRADNTSGKSTCTMAILYGLGLEGMLGPGHRVPFSECLTDRLLDGNRQIIVTQSEVQVLIENHKSEKIWVRRSVTGEPRTRELIQTAIETDQKNWSRRDFYVRTKMSAQAESGFHAFLSEFMGLKLPSVMGSDGERVPLYLECLFPYFFVDQLTGWRDIKARMPTYLRIPEMAKRSSEYILDLEVLKKSLRRQELEQESNAIRDEWRKTIERYKQRFQGSGAIFRGVSVEPESTWPGQSKPETLIIDGKGWLYLWAAKELATKRLNEISDAIIPKTEKLEDALLSQMQVAEIQLSKLQNKYERTLSESESELAQVEAIDTRLSALAEDLARYEDQKRLEDRRGIISSLAVSHSSCPACGQTIHDALLPQTTKVNPMSTPQNIEFIKDQIRTFKKMREEASRSREIKTVEAASFKEEIGKALSLIHTQRRTMELNVEGVSIAAVQEQLKLEERLQKIEAIEVEYSEMNREFENLAGKWATIEAGLKANSKQNIGEADRVKIKAFNDVFIDQLEAYNFKSFPISEIEIGEDSYRPMHRGYELGFTSASDAIRVIWAYALGLLELSAMTEMNHPGFLVFDEPRQQSADPLSYQALLQRATKSLNWSRQVIFATSETPANLKRFLQGKAYKAFDFTGRILKRLPADVRL